MVVYDKHNYFFLGILITICLLIFLAILLTRIKPDFTRFKLTFSFGSGPGFTQKIRDYYNKLFESKYKKMYEQLLEENRILKQENQGHINDKSNLSKQRDALTDTLQKLNEDNRKSVLRKQAAENDDDDELNPNFFDSEQEKRDKRKAEQKARRDSRTKKMDSPLKTVSDTGNKAENTLSPLRMLFN